MDRHPIPTNEVIEARRPDMVLKVKTTKTIWIIDVACPWDPSVPEREREKIEKYKPLAADLGGRKKGWTIRVAAVVIGALGTIGSLCRQLAQIQLWESDEIPRIVSNLQYQVVKSGARIIRQHLSETGQ